MKSQKYFLVILVSLNGYLFGNTVEQAFTDIYNKATWGRNAYGEGSSGDGSRLATTQDYRDFLQKFLRTMNIKTVVDIGCGDWEFSQHIDWQNVHYTGYDVVKSVIEKNQKQFSKNNIHFVHGNALTTNLPEADLLICKDVLQHLSIENIHLFLKQTAKFKYCLITNDVNPRTLTSHNEDILNGSYRRLDLTCAPFNVAGRKVLTYRGGDSVKQVLFISKFND